MQHFKTTFLAALRYFKVGRRSKKEDQLIVIVCGPEVSEPAGRVICRNIRHLRWDKVPLGCSRHLNTAYICVDGLVDTEDKGLKRLTGTVDSLKAPMLRAQILEGLACM